MVLAEKVLEPPKITIRRLSFYLRCLNSLTDRGIPVVSSQELAEILHLNPAQVRKDLAYFGDFGKRGVGYNVGKLREHIVKILGLHQRRNVAIIGAGGRLGQALALYKNMEKRNFKVVALFDNDPKLIGKKVGDVGEIRKTSDLGKLVKKLQIEIIILTVPSAAVYEVFELVQLAGIHAVLNFAPIKLPSTDDVVVNNVDLTMELELLSYHLNRKNIDDPEHFMEQPFFPEEIPLIDT